MRWICVYCGSKEGVKPEYRQAAQQLGKTMVEQGLGLVYGGGSVGLMGAVSDAVLEAGGKVRGVIPRGLATKEAMHPGVEDMHVVTDMHARKALLQDLADVFVTLPGGFGTLEEIAEVLSWSQLGLHGKPIGLLNIAGYFDALVTFIGHAVGEGFIKSQYAELLLVNDRPEKLLTDLLNYELPAHHKFHANSPA
ncbi:LOG family protein YvdD [Planctomycetes bacterium Pan216]|uniref:Cytokinin riboside 5'-monophosphate phosphoribohydrolase n=1 Tax=Kolteria novifilia TaxID=2527975 RepID=A0A518B8Z9_9BACT|nr:LOG family protein YvdD [Planctomycetes bacterium Pan216]